MGLTKSALILRSGRMNLLESDPPATLEDVAEDIERALSDIEEPVDEIIAGFANGQAWDRLNKP